MQQELGEGGDAHSCMLKSRLGAASSPSPHLFEVGKGRSTLGPSGGEIAEDKQVALRRYLVPSAASLSPPSEEPWQRRHLGHLIVPAPHQQPTDPGWQPRRPSAARLEAPKARFKPGDSTGCPKESSSVSERDLIKDARFIFLT